MQKAEPRPVRGFVHFPAKIIKKNALQVLTEEAGIYTIRVSQGGLPQRSTGPDCKSGGSAFEGSNPSPPTRINYVLAACSMKAV